MVGLPVYRCIVELSEYIFHFLICQDEQWVVSPTCRSGTQMGYLLSVKFRIQSLKIIF